MVEFLPISEFCEQRQDQIALYPEKGNDPENLTICSKDKSHPDHNGKGKRNIIQN
jgi:hypothetical protein